MDVVLKDDERGEDEEKIEMRSFGGGICTSLREERRAGTAQVYNSGENNTPSVVRYLEITFY